jgi:predicted nicotinamide N-methyase
MGALLPLAACGSVPTAISIQGSAAAQLVASQVGLEQLAVETPQGDAILFAPASQERLLDVYVANAAAFGDRTPYYGIVWPSARVLSRQVRSYLRAGDDVVELGAGLGLVGIAAALTGLLRSVLLVDHDPVAVELALASARASVMSALSPVTGVALDWAESNLSGWPERCCDVVLCADVLYEAGAAPLVAAVAARLLRPGGRLVIADGKHRPFREDFRAELALRGFETAATADNVQEKCEGHTSHVVVESYARV